MPPILVHTYGTVKDLSGYVHHESDNTKAHIWLSEQGYSGNGTYYVNQKRFEEIETVIKAVPSGAGYFNVELNGAQTDVAFKSEADFQDYKQHLRLAIGALVMGERQ